MATVEAPFDQVKILVEVSTPAIDPEDPPVLTYPQLCLVNLSRSMSFTNNMQDDEIPDCTDVTKPARIRREVRSKDFEISGEGKLHLTNLATMLEWWEDGAAKVIRADIGSSSNGGQRIQGSFYLATFEITGTFKETATATVSFMPADTGAIAITALQA
jgi:hypothetical protein